MIQKVGIILNILCLVLTLRTPANVLTDRAGRRYSGGEKRQ